jgi:hypothetical protein
MRSMTTRSWIAICLCGVIVLSVSLAPGSARADTGGHEADRPIRLYATASVGPIGRMANGALTEGSLIINGHPAYPGQPVWSGDLLQSGAGARVCVPLDSIGEVRLAGRTTVRLAAKHSTRDDGASGLTLIASLAQGEISVELEPAVNAYVRAAGAEYASSEGAAFLASVREGGASIAVKSGEVRREGQGAQHQYTIRPVGHGSNIRVPAGGLQRLQVQVLEDDTPVPGVGVLFALDTSGAVVGLLGLGTLSGTTANVVTDANGMAAVQFVARNSSGSSPISASVEGTRVSWTGQITVKSREGSRAGAWAFAVLGGAAAAGGVAYALTRDKKPALQAQPPIVKNP